jgi:hypothetical protein
MLCGFAAGLGRSWESRIVASKQPLEEKGKMAASHWLEASSEAQSSEEVVGVGETLGGVVRGNAEEDASSGLCCSTPPCWLGLPTSSRTVSGAWRGKAGKNGARDPSQCGIVGKFSWCFRFLA